MGARSDWDSLQRGPCWPYPPNACTQTAVPSPSDIGIERCLFHPVPHTCDAWLLTRSRWKVLLSVHGVIGTRSSEDLLATPTKCNHLFRYAITIRHRNRALSFPCSLPHCDAWRLKRSRWKRYPWVHSAIRTRSSGDPDGHTHQMQAVKQLRHHLQTCESSAVFSIESPTL